MLRAALALTIGLTLGGLALAGFGYYLASSPLSQPESGAEFHIQKGTNGADIAAMLEDQKVIKNQLVFRIATRLLRADQKFKAGKYRLTGPMSTLDVIKSLQEGQILQVKFAIPEGFNQWQIAQKLSESFPNFHKSDFEKELNNPELRELLPTGATTLEGYLFPETYTVSEDASPKEIFATMIKLFFEKLQPEIILLAKDQNLDTHGLVTLASIIEKETGAPEERGLISGVFHNRLNKGMKLQTDPTVIYGMWETYDGNIRKRDLLTPTAYNTYVINGLPPGPIASPGLEALVAAARPQRTNALYFVALGDGSGKHEFSETLLDHNRAVSRYLKRLRRTYSADPVSKPSKDKDSKRISKGSDN